MILTREQIDALARSGINGNGSYLIDTARAYHDLRDGVTDAAAWLATRCDCTDYGIGSEQCEYQEAANSLRAVVARVEGDES